METTCHNCKSKDIYFDGDFYVCLHCRYMWIPEITPKEFKEKMREEIKRKDGMILKESKKDSPG